MREMETILGGLAFACLIASLPSRRRGPSSSPRNRFRRTRHPGRPAHAAHLVVWKLSCHARHVSTHGLVSEVTLQSEHKSDPLSNRQGKDDRTHLARTQSGHWTERSINITAHPCCGGGLLHATRVRSGLWLERVFQSAARAVRRKQT